jgi:hypothetical protein
MSRLLLLVVLTAAGSCIETLGTIRLNLQGALGVFPRGLDAGTALVLKVMDISPFEVTALLRRYYFCFSLLNLCEASESVLTGTAKTTMKYHKTKELHKAERNKEGENLSNKAGDK